MKKIVFAVAILALVSCGSDDDSTSRSSAKIEITIDKTGEKFYESLTLYIGLRTYSKRFITK